MEKKVLTEQALYYGDVSMPNGFEINSDIIIKNNYRVPVFEVKIAKNVILYDQDKDLLKQENETVSVDGVNGPEIILGSLVEVSTNGNWPTIFDAKK